jgi:hypothetical protein
MFPWEVLLLRREDISCDQYLDLVYSQSDTLYDMVPHAPLPSNDLTRPAPKTHADRVASYDTKTTPSLMKTSEVNAVQSTSSQQPRDKKKNKGKSKNSSNQ